jgi:hypothetical protein
MKKTERDLLRLNNALNEQAQDMLHSYAEFLCTQPENVAHINITRQQPKAISAAEDESVVAAIKRLSASYFMLDRDKLLNSASLLMAQHVMQGREAVEVIEELEQSFASAYKVYCKAIEESFPTSDKA